MLSIVGAGLLTVIPVILAVAGGTGSGPRPKVMAAHFASTGEIVGLEKSIGHSIYWAGARPRKRFELKYEMDGSVYLRYLPPASAVGDPRVTFLTVGSYPVMDAQGAVRRAASQAGTSVERVASGGIVLANPASEGSVYLAYPNSDLEIEVYDPTPGRAMELIRAGAIRPVGQG